MQIKIFSSLKDNDYNALINIVISYLNLNTLRLVITATAQAALAQCTTMLNEPETGWNAAYALTLNPATDNTTNTSQKNHVRDQISLKLSVVYKDIPNSALTQTDRDTLLLPGNNSVHTPIGTLSYAPKLDIENREHLLLKIRVTDPANPHTKEMPHGQHVQVAVGFKDATTGIIMWDIDVTKEVHKFLSDIIFRQEHVGKKATLRWRYVNTKGAVSVWSEDLDVFII